ncbi:MAG: extracellular solute-binding protein [Oscillospiraceae bacterium]|nr:extracellular solute-binding protein [Oscillospiraceae bacterium]
MKKNLKSLIASVLALMMIFSLAACGKTDNSGGSVTPSGGKAGETPAFTYVSSFREVPNEENEALGAICFTSDGFYTSSSDVVGQREPREGEVQEWEGQFDILEESLWFVSFDGKRTKLENYEPLSYTASEGHDGSIELSRLASDPSGELAALYQTWEYWYDAPEGMTEEDPEYWNYYHYENNWYLRTMDGTGREKSLTKIDFSDGDWFWVNSLCYVGDSILMTDSSGVRIYHADGTSAGTVSVAGYVGSAFTLRDGTPCISYSDERTGEMFLAALDLKTGRVTQTWKAPRYAYDIYPGTGDYDLYYQSGVNVYGYKLADESSEKLFDWLNADVMQQNLSGWTARADGSFFAVTNTWDSKWENVTTEFVTLEKKPYDQVPQKSELTLACMWADSNLQTAVIKFNRSSNVRIKVIDYSEYNTDEDWNAGMTKLTTEIMAGSMPDILSLSNLPYQQLASRGLLEDLYPYIDRDSELNRADFLPNVLRALEVGGKLCSTVTTFTVTTLAGSARVVGDEPGWSFDDLRAALATMPEGCTVLDEFTTSGDILRAELTIDADYYIDWETGKVNFDSKAFTDLLEFSRLFPNSFDSFTYNWDEYESDDQRIAEGKQMLTRMYLGSFEDIISTEAQFGGDMTYIGFPTATGVGSYLNLQSGYGISSACADKETAWQFLRGFMTEKAIDNSYYWGFPANQKQLEKKLQEAMTVEYAKDEKGNYLLDDEGKRIPIAKGGFWIEGMDEPTEFYALTQEQADKVMNVITLTDKLYTENTAVLDIIFEQTDAFFSGQKTAEEVAQLVQGKMNIYVNEQR